MKCKICDGEMIQKSRTGLAVVGIFMLASLALAFVIPHFWVPAPDPCLYRGIPLVVGHARSRALVPELQKVQSLLIRITIGSSQWTGWIGIILNSIAPACNRRAI